MAEKKFHLKNLTATELLIAIGGIITLAGAEYFEGLIGWPLTLLVAGLLSMGTGLFVEKIRRQYFPKLTKNQQLSHQSLDTTG